MLGIATITTALGPISLAARDGVLCALEFTGEPAGSVRFERLRSRFPGAEFRSGTAGRAARGDCAARLRDYLAGDLQAFAGLEMAPGGTPFQRKVWRALTQIPAGAAWSYAELAGAMGRPKAVRAVGAANGANPIAIAIPCHRVIGADGALRGYAGGLERKAWLLRHEGWQSA